MFSGFILIGLTLAILSFLLYCPFALTHKVYTFMSAYLKHRKLMVSYNDILEKFKKSSKKLTSIIELPSLYELFPAKGNCLYPLQK